MAAPIYEESSTLAFGNGSCDVAYTTTVNADDILIIHVANDDDNLFSTPSGWTLLNDEAGGFGIFWGYSVFWKRAVGSETGTVTCTGSAACWGVMYRISGCITTGTPYTGFVSDAITTSTSTTLSVVGDTDYLKVALHNFNDDVTYTSSSSGDWTLGDNQNSAFQSDASFALLTSENTGTTSSTMDWIGTDLCGATGFRLEPASTSSRRIIIIS